MPLLNRFGIYKNLSEFDLNAIGINNFYVLITEVSQSTK